MKETLPPLDDAMLDLLEAEKRVVPPAGARERVLAASLARIGTKGGPGNGGGGEGGAGGAGARALGGSLRAWPLIGAFAAGVVSTAIVFSLRSGGPAEKIVYVDRPSAPSASASVQAPDEREPPAPVIEPSAEAPRPPSSRASDHIAAERALLDVARGAVASGDPDHALAALDRHAREFPHGALSEEREALAVKALVMKGRYDEARARGAAFRERWPKSVMTRAVESSLATIP
jgi:hypothetical protein